MQWKSRLQEESDLKMFSNDPKLNPRLPSPTSFDGVKPSYVEWSEEILTFLSVTDYQEFVPILQAVTGHKDVITKKIFVEGVLSELIEEIKDKNTELEEVTSGARIVADQDAEIDSIKGEIKTLEEKRDSRVLTLLKADNFLRYVLLHSTTGDPNVMVRRIMRTTSSDSEVVTGLEIWRQMAVTYAGSAQTRVVTLLKQIMTPSEWNPEKSPNVLQLYHHWLELISKYESLSSEKIAPSIKITLALQNVRGPLANALSLSITEKSTWNDIHNLLINYFNNSITTDSKEIYQFDISGKVSKEDSVNQVGKKGKGKSKKSKGQSKGKGAPQNQPQKGKGKQNNQKERQNQKEKVNGPHGQVNLGHGIRIKVKVEKEKERDLKYVLIVVAKVIQLINVGGLRKLVLQGTVQIRDKCTISQLSPGIIPSLSCPQINSEVFRISDLFISNNLTINHTTHNHLHHQRCPQSLPLAKVKDSVDITSESTTSHQMSQKTTSWRSTSAIPSMTLVHHCLKNVKNLGQHS